MTSPHYKRKKIFELATESASIVTAEFQGQALDESKVESYKMPSVKL